MTKGEFLDGLKSELLKHSISNIDNMIEYYDEMICDRVEDGMTEEEAVNSIDSIETIVNEAILDKSVPTLVREKVKSSREKAKKNNHEWLWITLAIVGFPVWFPILLMLAILALTFVGVFWVLVGVAVTVLFSLAISALACLVGSFTIFLGWIPFPTALIMIGSAVALAGLCILLWKPIIALCKVAGRGCKNSIIAIKKKFI